MQRKEKIHFPHIKNHLLIHWYIVNLHVFFFLNLFLHLLDYLT